MGFNGAAGELGPIIIKLSLKKFEMGNQDLSIRDKKFITGAAREPYHRSEAQGCFRIRQHNRLALERF